MSAWLLLSSTPAGHLGPIAVGASPLALLPALIDRPCGGCLPRGGSLLGQLKDDQPL